LAKSAEEQELQQQQQQQQDDETLSPSSSTHEVQDECYGERKAKRMCSPRSTIPNDQAIVPPPLSPTQHQAPWGQFVDMLVPEEEEYHTASFLPGLYHQCYHNESSGCQLLSSCRSRRSSPYGAYHNKRSNNKKGPIPNDLRLSDSTLDSKSTFRLTPRRSGSTNRSKEPTEQLIVAFSGLNF
jgi:hypothetical protein